MEKKLRYLVYVVAILFVSPPLWALTDAEVEARLDQYEAKIKALESELANAKKPPVYEQNLGASSSGKIEKQIQQIKDKMDAEQERFRVNGFITAAVSKADDPIDGFYNISDSPTFNGDSKVGLQFNYKMDDRADATVQLISRGHGGTSGGADAWGVAAEWAYLGYKVTDDVKVRAGRLRVPEYLYSESIDVGYTYPWVRPPMEMYIPVFTAYNGADLLYNFSTGSVRHALQLFVGGIANSGDQSGDQQINVDVKDMYGFNITSTHGPWTSRFMMFNLKIDGTLDVRADTLLPAVSPVPGVVPALDQAAAFNLAALASQGFTSCDLDKITGVYCAPGGFLHKSGDEEMHYYAVGGQYDNGSLFVTSEISKLEALNAILYSDYVAGYVTTGYRFGPWTPYVTYAHRYDTETTANLTAAGLAPQSLKSRSIGVRRELTPSLSAKFEWNNFYDLENNGGFSGSLGDDVNVYTFALDAVF